MFDVIIVGGGPVGLFLACELKLAGIDPVVLERLPEASQADKAHGIGGQVVRLLDHRGLFEWFGGQGAPTPAPAFYFGTLPVPLHILGADNPTYVLPINQRDIERVLGERAAELGVDVRREVELRSFTQSDDHVDLVVDSEGSESELSTRYLVDCDGAHSNDQAGVRDHVPGNLRRADRLPRGPYRSDGAHRADGAERLQPETIDDLLNQTAGKILDQFAIEHTLFRRWDGTSPALDHKAAVRV